jgi:hypothetical protein
MLPVESVSNCISPTVRLLGVAPIRIPYIFIIGLADDVARQVQGGGLAHLLFRRACMSREHPHGRGFFFFFWFFFCQFFVNFFGGSLVSLFFASVVDGGCLD